MLIDTSQQHQNYIEDCEICCNPIQLDVQIENQEISYFFSQSIEQ
jgi:hypothetical protein